MNDLEKKELVKYFILAGYRDSDIFLEDEYLELEDIIKRNKIARYFESLRLKYLRKMITEEEYNNICNKYLKRIFKKN